MKTTKMAAAWLAVAATLLVSGPALAQEAQAPATEPEPMMSAEAEEALDQALSGVTHEDMSLTFRSYYFPSLQGNTLAMVGFEVGTEPLTYGVDAFASPAADGPVEVAQMELFGAVLQDGAEVARFGNDFTVGEGAAGLSAVKSFGDTLAAGAYEVVWGVRDTIANVTASRRDTLEVPDFMSAGLATSSILLVTGQPGPAQGQFEAFAVYDGIRVLTVTFPDDLDRELDADLASVMLTYIIAGAQPDPATRSFDLEITYSITDEEGEGLWHVAPQPLDRPTVGQQIPLAEIDSLEAGNAYVFEVLVKDLAAGTETTTRVPFEIAG